MMVETGGLESPSTGSSTRILAIDDDTAILKMLEIGLAQQGYEVYIAESGDKALALMREREPELVLLDVMMPGIDGYETCRMIRTMSSVPIIMISALRSEREIVQGLDAGADDYVPKPFSLIELSARIKAALRRVPQRDKSAAAHPPASYDQGNLVIDPQNWTVTVRGQQIALSNAEFLLLYHLASNTGQVVSVRELFERVWGEGYAHQQLLLRTHIAMLRSKIEEDPQTPKYVVAIAGEGYIFKAPADKEQEQSNSSPP